MKKSLPWILLAVSVVLNAFFIGGFVHAKLQHARIASDRGARNLMAERLNLSEEQREMLRASRRETVEEAKRIFEEGAPARDAFWDELAKAEPDVSRLDALTDQAAANSVALTRAATAQLVDALARLSPEQRTILLEAIERRPLLGGRYLMSGGRLHGDRPRFPRPRFGAIGEPDGFGPKDGAPADGAPRGDGPPDRAG